MTNSWTDIGVSDCILIMGSNTAENHPIAMKWVLRAKDKGATVINVDPRFTRTSTKADIYAPLRSGTDIAFLGGMIKYLLDKDLIFRDYVVNYTNASFIVSEKFDFRDGLFTGYNPEKRAYDKATWVLEKDEKGIPKRDMTLQNPRCVYQMMKKHYARYDLDMVSSITGTPKADLIKVYETYATTGKPDRVGTMLYAMGWTQHTVGTQNIRAASMIQLLLGNVGMAGGGVNALRGESNVQGITDTYLFNILPGYLPHPSAALETLAKYNDTTPKTTDPMSVNWWGNRPKYIASLLKSFFGENATKETDFGYEWLPKLDVGQNASWLYLFDEMFNGKFLGFICMGMNPACSSPNSDKTRKALAKLDWMVDIDLFENETSNFWKGPGIDPKKIKTEVFLLPAASSVEKEGSVTDSSRTGQWRYKACDPPGDAKADGQIVHELYMRVKELYVKEGGALSDPILKLKWDYAKDGKVDPHAVAKEINGYFCEDIAEHPVDKKAYKKGTLVPNFVFLLADGRTACGNWLYSGSFTEAGNMMARRDKTPIPTANIFPRWGYSWPLNRRIIYNRASVDPNGNPWDPKRAVIQWDGTKWVGDVPDNAVLPMALPNGKYPFIMKPDGVASFFGPGLADGPFPEHYEALECPIEKNPLSSQRINPATPLFKGDLDKYTTCDPKFPFVGTTYRLTEHWQTGLMTRYQSWLVEAEPQMFVELSVELAKLRGIKNGDRVTISSPRGKMWAKAMVTSRLKPFNVAGQTVHLVGMTWHYGWLVPRDGGDSSNILTPSIGDANTMIPEYKVFLVNVTKEEKPKVEKKPEAKAEAKPEPKAEKKPEPKPEAKPGPKAETKK
jgi:formate dehydrogenase major subunit